MEFLEIFRTAWESLRANRTRTALTLLGMVIGVFAILASVTAVKVIDVYFNESMNFLGSATFTVTKFPALSGGTARDEMRNRKDITYEQVERLRNSLSQPAAVSLQEDFAIGAMRYRDRETGPNIFLIGTDDNFLGNFTYELAQGRFLSAQDVHYARPIVVLGSSVAEALFPNEQALGKTVEMKGIRFQVVGVLRAKGNFLGFSQDQRVYAPVTYLLSLYGNANRNIASVSVRAPNLQLLPAVMDDVIGRMRAIRKVPPGEDNDFEIETNNSMRSIFEAFTSTLTVGGAGIGLIALFAAGIGIMNIMLVSVTERTREIGLRKSVGATRRDIIRQFLLEAFFLCQVGGIVGIVLGVLFGNVVALYFGISAAFPVGWAVAAVVMVTAISLGFGGYPAYKASRLDPIDSLRYE